MQCIGSQVFPHVRLHPGSECNATGVTLFSHPAGQVPPRGLSSLELGNGHCDKCSRPTALALTALLDAGQSRNFFRLHFHVVAPLAAAAAPEDCATAGTFLPVFAHHTMAMGRGEVDPVNKTEAEINVFMVLCSSEM